MTYPVNPAKEKALWMLSGERFPHGWVTGEFERTRYPSATQVINAFLDRYPHLTQIRHANTGDLIWHANAPKERAQHQHKPFPDILR